MGWIFRRSRIRARGARLDPVRPRMMVKVLVYAYATSDYRRVGRAELVESVAFLSAAENLPDFRTIASFASATGRSFRDCSFRWCSCAGERPGEVGARRGGRTKVKANAQKHKAMSYRRMKDAEDRLQAEVDEFLRRAGGDRRAGGSASTGRTSAATSCRRNCSAARGA